MTCLTELPVETLLNVSSHLTTRDLSSLRLTCKALEHSLFNFFGTEFYTVRQVFMHLSSLQHLVNIAAHPQLKHFVKKVFVGLDSFCSEAKGSPRKAVKDIVEGQRNLVDTHIGKDMLVQIFQGLPNLNHVQVRDFKGLHARPRDGTPYRSYGVKQLEKWLRDEEGIASHDMITTFDIAHGRDIVSTVYHSIVEAGIKISTFEVITRNLRSNMNWSHIHVPDSQLATYAPVLASWTTLMLCLDAQSNLTDSSEPGTLSWDTFNSNFLSLCPNLQHLRLNFEEFDFFPRTTPAGVFTNPIFDSIALLENLRILELGKTTIVDTTLCNNITALAPTLEEFGLQNIQLEAKSWPAVLDALETCTHLKRVRFARCIGVWWKPTAEAEFKYHKRANTFWPAYASQQFKADTHEALMVDLRARMIMLTREVFAEHGISYGTPVTMQASEPPIEDVESEEEDEEDEGSESSSEVDSGESNYS